MIGQKEHVLFYAMWNKGKKTTKQLNTWNANIFSQKIP